MTYHQTGTIRALLSPRERAIRCLATIPPAVQGQNGSGVTYRAARLLAQGFNLSEEVALELLHVHYNPRCLPPWSEGELRHKVGDAARGPSDRPPGYLLGGTRASSTSVVTSAPRQVRYPDLDPEFVAQMVRQGPRARDLALNSPEPLDDEDAGRNTEGIITALLAGDDEPDPLVCVGLNAKTFATRRLSRWVRSGWLPRASLVVPARMSARTGHTMGGKRSEHCLENTGLRRYVVVEFDMGSIDEQAARLWHLSEFVPLVLVVHSAGKSLHGWFPVGGATPEEVQLFLAYAAKLGADKYLLRNRSQFVRMPGGTRDNGCRQSVFWWQPGALVASVPAIDGKEMAA